MPYLAKPQPIDVDDWTALQPLIGAFLGGDDVSNRCLQSLPLEQAGRQRLLPFIAYHLKKRPVWLNLPENIRNQLTAVLRESTLMQLACETGLKRLFQNG